MAFVKAYPKEGSSRAVVYEDEKGNKSVYQHGSRSWRTNNPGNLAKGAYCDRHGAIGDDGENAIFPDLESGLAALQALLKSQGYVNHTISEAMKLYAPYPINNPEAYTAFILKNTKLAKSRTLASLAPEEFAKLLGAIQTFEGWKEGKITQEAAS